MSQIKKMKQYSEGQSCRTVLKGTTGLMCTHCYAYTLFTVNGDFMGTVRDGEDLLLDYRVSMVCPGCKRRSVYVEIESGLVDTVSILNKKGYYTTMCCHGHVGESRPRMFISFQDEVSDMFTSLPEGWRIDKSWPDFIECLFKTSTEQLHALEAANVWAKALPSR